MMEIEINVKANEVIVNLAESQEVESHPSIWDSENQEEIAQFVEEENLEDLNPKEEEDC